MASTRRALFWLLAVFTALSAAASSAPTFCKCTCFKNSTIIPLGPEKLSNSDDASDSSSSIYLRDDHDAWLDGANDDQAEAITARDDSTPDDPLSRRTASTSCSECTRAFCLSQGIDICHNAKDDDVVTLCFQRDSNKDKLIVWGFLIGVFGLLGWSAARRALAWRDAKTRGPGGHHQSGLGYAPVGRV